MEPQMLQSLYRRAHRIHGDGGRVARRSGIPIAKLTSLRHNDLSGWTTSMVERLARVAMVDAAIVWAGGEVATGPTIRFLQQGGWPDFHPSDLRLLMEAVAKGSSLRTLSEQLGVTLIHFDPVAPTRRRGFLQAYELATEVRERLDKPSDPLMGLSDLVARRFGVYVLAATMRTPRLEAAAIKDAHGGAIVLNTQREGRAVMVRRSLAHELCHVVFDPRERGVQTALDGTEALGTDATTTDPGEQRARAFAAELLVPKRGLLGLLGSPQHEQSPGGALGLVERVAEHFAAPPELVANHLSNHGYLDPSIREHVARRARDEVQLPQVAEPIADILNDYVNRAVGEGIITAGRGRELIMADPR